MDAQITDTFIKSLKRSIWHESKVYKFYSLLRYDIPNLLRNIWNRKNTDWDKVPTNSEMNCWDDNLVHTEGEI
jgi:hypothetical protein